MGSLFDVDSPLYQKVSRAVDILWLGILWAVCCLGIFTAGAATAALFYTIAKTVKKDRGYITKTYFRAFRENFKQGSILWLIWMLCVLITGVDMHMTYVFLQNGKGIGNLLILFVVIMAYLLVWGCYLFTYIARFEDSIRQILKNTALMAIQHIQWSFVLLVLVLVVGFVVWVYPLLFVAAGGVLMYLESIALEKVYHFYMPEESEDEICRMESAGRKH